jgi:UPF0755 protein
VNDPVLPKKRAKRRQRPRSERPAPDRPRSGRPRKTTGRLRLALGLMLAGGVLLGVLLGFVSWARGRGPGNGQRVLLDVPASMTPSELANALVQHGVLRRAFPFSLYFRLFTRGVAPGRHVLRDDLGPRALAQRLSRSPSRTTRRVTIPEGWNFRQISGRLGDLEVCDPASFETAVFDPTLRAELGILGPSVEGYLFPATYELSVDTEPPVLIRQLVGETRKRLARLTAEYPGAIADLAQKDGFGEHEIVTLASIVERESGNAKEDAVIAGVFFNRLRDPDFRPARSLQSDPTAAYGCLVAPDSAPSCAAYRGQVLPAMLRDAQNAYNTYRHPGLPPGPISNPGESALRAVLAPNKSDYLYFVAAGGGRHRFSRTFEEHRQAVTGGR